MPNTVAPKNLPPVADAAQQFVKNPPKDQATQPSWTLPPAAQTPPQLKKPTPAHAGMI